jgi:riboflavin transporter FmnP
MVREIKPKVPPTRRLTAVALFSALALAINVSHLNIPAPFAPFLSYEIWEIPIVVAFIMFGLGAGVFVSLINLVGLLLIQPGPLPSGPFYNFAATLTMFLGIALGHKITQRMNEGYLQILIGSTGLGILTRSLGMVLINAIFLPFPPPIGFSIPVHILPSVLIAIAVFNSTLALYTIPLAYSIVRAILPRYRFALAYPFEQKARVAPNLPAHATNPK